ncbi:MAG: EfeM/EfeO family lipoprotein [Myxococcota bacterium]
MKTCRPMILCLFALGCAPTGATSSSSSGGSQPQSPTLAVKSYVTEQLELLHTAVDALKNAAPAPDADGWNPTADAAAVEAMRTEWKKARNAYERVEGAIAVLFPELDAATDERYDGFIAEAADDNLFDGTGVTGVHAVERILWADSHRPEVVTFESGLPNYVAASFPTTEQQAREYKTSLLARLEEDVHTMLEEFGPLALDPSSAFRGVVGSLEEQLEKVNLAYTAEDESRYAQHTLGDMRANLSGGKATFDAFRAELRAKEGGADLETKVTSSFGRIETAYNAISGDAIPAVPEGWNPESPSAEHLQTPYGQLFTILSEEADPEREGSLVHSMNLAADLLGIPQLP